jgi:hypothetical protein
MSKHTLRHDKTCQNCGYLVEKRYCSNCGQENKESRQSFFHLFQHFFEDLTHYEGRFWQTIRYLFTRPGYLTKAFLAGKRNRYVVPIRLYLFVSFFTFLLPHLLPDFREPNPYETPGRPTRERDSVQMNFHFYRDSTGTKLYVPNEYTSVRQMDSLEALRPETERMSSLQRWLQKKYIGLLDHNPTELAGRFFSSFGKNFPKALFIYLPLFAFIIWLIHGKKKWFYFDHGIFVLHYFSFILLGWCLYLLSANILNFFTEDRKLEIEFLSLAAVPLFLYWLTYFYIAHKRFYMESGMVSFLKSSTILFLNFVLFLVLLFVLAMITLLML